MIGPSLALISIARSEDLVACAQGDGTGASRTGRDDLQVRPIGPDADDAAAEPHRLVVSARAKRRAPVADGQVKIAVHPQLDPTGDVIIPSAWSGNRAAPAPCSGRRADRRGRRHRCRERPRGKAREPRRARRLTHSSPLTFSRWSAKIVILPPLSPRPSRLRVAA